MDLNSIPIMAALKERMHWLKNRQGVIAQNVANANTPGYKAQELQAQDFSEYFASIDKEQRSSVRVKSMALRGSQSGHMQGFSDANNRFEVVEAEVKDSNSTGNTVLLEDEMMKMNKTQIEYGMITNLYKKNVNLLRTAIKGR